MGTDQPVIDAEGWTRRPPHTQIIHFVTGLKRTIPGVIGVRENEMVHLRCAAGVEWRLNKSQIAAVELLSATPPDVPPIRVEQWETIYAEFSRVQHTLGDLDNRIQALRMRLNALYPGLPDAPTSKPTPTIRQ